MDFKRGSLGEGRKQQRERRRAHGRKRGMEVWSPERGGESVEGAEVGAARHSRELTELQREVFCFD